MISKYKSLILKIIISVILFSYLFSQINISDLLAIIRLADPRYIPLILLLLISNYLISAVRWKKLLIFPGASEVNTLFLTKLYFMGSFFNNFMPTSIGGDLYKIFRLGKKLGDNSNAFSATFMERFTGLVVLVLISYIGLLQTLSEWLYLLPEFIKSNTALLLAVEILIFSGFWILSLAGFYLLKLLSSRFGKINKIYFSLLQYKSYTSVLTWAFVTSIIVQLLSIFTQYFIFMSLGITLPFFNALFLLPLITLASFFIPSLNGLGVQDALYVQLFAPLGVSSQIALSASILYHIFRLAVSLIGGIFYAIDKETN